MTDGQPIVECGHVLDDNGAVCGRVGRATVATRLINKRSCLTDTISACAPTIVSGPFYCDSHELCQKEKSLQLTGYILVHLSVEVFIYAHGAFFQVLTSIHDDNNTL